MAEELRVLPRWRQRVHHGAAQCRSHRVDGPRTLGKHGGIGTRSGQDDLRWIERCFPQALTSRQAHAACPGLSRPSTVHVTCDHDAAPCNPRVGMDSRVLSVISRPPTVSVEARGARGGVTRVRLRRPEGTTDRGPVSGEADHPRGCDPPRFTQVTSVRCLAVHGRLRLDVFTPRVEGRAGPRTVYTRLWRLDVAS